MGDKGCKEDHEKSQKQKATKQAADARAKQEKQPKPIAKYDAAAISFPLLGSGLSGRSGDRRHATAVVRA